MIEKLKDKEFLKKKTIEFIHEYKKKILITAVICFVCLVGFTVYIQKQTTTLVISLNYKEASNGLNPNCSRFNIFDLKSDEVLERTLELCGLDNCYTKEDLNKDITIIQTNRESTNIQTTYKIQYKKPIKLFDISSKQLTKFLFKAYKEYFKENYSSNNEILNYKIQNFENNDYLTVVKSLELTTSNISNYIKDRLKENTNFRSSEDYTFEDLKKAIDNVSDVNIYNLNAYISENGLTKDSNSLKNLLTYKNQLLDMDYQTNLIGYETRKEGISLYDSQMSSIVLIPSVDENEDYYMSKTKIGIDYLAKDSNDYLTESEWFQNEISKNNDILSKLNTSNSNDTKEKADVMIENIQETLVDISNKTKTLDQEYMEYKNKNYISSNIYNDKLSIKKVIILFVVSDILAFTLVISYIFINRKLMVLTLR